MNKNKITEVFSLKCIRIYKQNHLLFVENSNTIEHWSLDDTFKLFSFMKKFVFEPSSVYDKRILFSGISVDKDPLFFHNKLNFIFRVNVQGLPIEFQIDENREEISLSFFMSSWRNNSYYCLKRSDNIELYDSLREMFSKSSSPKDEESSNIKFIKDDEGHIIGIKI